MSEVKEMEKLPEGWKQVKLGDLIKETFSGEWGDNPIDDKDTFPVLSTLAIDYEGRIDFSKATLRKLNRNKFKKLRLYKGTILIEKSGGSTDTPAGKVAIIKKDFDGTCSNFIQILRVKEDICDNFYLFYQLYYNFKNNLIKKYQQRTTGIINFILKDYFNDFLNFPPLPEQHKIAEILSTVDNAIEKTGKIIEKYKRIKQGLMQELLTKGIDENWQIRSEKTHKFKDSPLGRIPEEWEVVSLGEVFTIKAGGDIYDLDFSTEKDGNYKFPIYSNTLENKGLYGFARTYKFLENSITITGRGTLGVAIPRFEKFNAIIRLLVLIPEVKIDIVFVSEYINSRINFEIESTGVPQLTAPKVSKYLIPLPPLPEQQRITTVLSEIDEVIEKEKAHKEKLEKIKKGLMEDLLTGKVRVNHLIDETLKRVENVSKA